MFLCSFSKNVSIVVFISAVVVGIYFPTRHARRYKCVDTDEILENLHFGRDVQEDNSQNCNYRDVVFGPENNIPIEDVAKKKIYSIPDSGGEYKPLDCNPLPSSAIIVPYRDRPAQLETFLNYMHHFLQKQKLHYRIFIVDQNNNQLFNRAKLLNIGAKVAMSKKFRCLILHDVDLIPLNYANLYACLKEPRHMSSSLDTFRYNLPYLTLFGGAVAILSEQFEKVNGMSNLFVGWGGEDDDFYKRLNENNFIPCRLCPSISKYTMLFHRKNTGTSEDRFDLLKKSTERAQFDGLNTLNDNYTVEINPLYTRIVVS